MCAICGFTKCPSGCPNAEPVICDHFCSVCGYGIEFGEEYIVNDNDNYAHIDCLTPRETAEFLGFQVQEME